MKELIKKIKYLIRKIKNSRNISNRYVKNKQIDLNRQKKIVYILHSNHHKAGGDKVIYKQSQLISQLKTCGYSSEILHPENVHFKHDWFDHSVQFRKQLSFDPETDFVVLPEIWALPHARKLKEIGVNYAIYVQNGYFVNAALDAFPDESLDDAYGNASLILSISDDTTECLRLAFPSCSDKILRIFYSVDYLKFKSKSEKQNLITYMPRKLSNHSKLVTFFLKSQLPSSWKIEPIDGLNESGVVDLLSRSKIFLSFSEFEGCPLPPVEAAMSNNYVVGYTGEGAKEYWDSSLFTEVKPGNIRDFVCKIIHKINEMELNDFCEFISVQNLAKKYSKENELESINSFLYAVDKIMSDKTAT